MFVLFLTVNTGALGFSKSSWGRAGPDGLLHYFYFMAVIVLLFFYSCRINLLLFFGFFWMIPQKIQPLWAVRKRCVKNILTGTMAPFHCHPPSPLSLILSEWNNVWWNKRLRRGIVLQPHCPPMQDWPTATINHSYIMLLCCLHVENPLIPSETWTNSFSRVPLRWIISTLYAERPKWCTCILPSSSWKLLFRHSCCSNPISLLLLLIWFFFFFAFDLRQSVASGDSLRVYFYWDDLSWISLHVGPTDNRGSPGKWP